VKREKKNCDFQHPRVCSQNIRKPKLMYKKVEKPHTQYSATPIKQ